MDLAASFMIIVCSVFFGGWVIYTILFLAPWFPTRKRDINVIDRIIQWRDGTIFYDLGSGDGRVCLWLAQQHPHVTFVGVEISFFFHAIAHIRRSLSGCKNVRLIRGNALRHDVSDGDYVYVFGTHRTIDHVICDIVAPQVATETQIISYNFSVQKWEGAMRQSRTEGHTKVFVYEC